MVARFSNPTLEEERQDELFQNLCRKKEKELGRELTSDEEDEIAFDMNEMIDNLYPNIKLVRVKYGKKDTPKSRREYQIDGKGPVGTLGDFQERFPYALFVIVEKEEGKWNK